jgi:biopolymer transport protein ExbD
MALIQGSQSKKNLNVELNLLPVFDVLSVCICFLLMTVVWIEIRSLETKQAIGSQSSLESTKSSSVWLTIDDKNNLLVVLKSANGKETNSIVPMKNGVIDFDGAKLTLNSAAAKKFLAAHILPAKTTKYDQVIKLMDLAKQAGIQDIGLSPI